MSADEYRFRLFIAGKESNSGLAEKNLRALCNAYLLGRHHIEIVDVLHDCGGCQASCRQIISTQAALLSGISFSSCETAC